MIQPEPDPDLDMVCAIETAPGELDALPRLKGEPLIPARALGTIVDRIDLLHGALVWALEAIAELRLPWWRKAARWLARITQEPRSPGGEG